MSPKSLQKERFYESRENLNSEESQNALTYQNHHHHHHGENLVKHEIMSNYGDDDDERAGGENMDDEVEDLSKNWYINNF